VIGVTARLAARDDLVALGVLAWEMQVCCDRSVTRDQAWPREKSAAALLAAAES